MDVVKNTNYILVDNNDEPIPKKCYGPMSESKYVY